MVTSWKIIVATLVIYTAGLITGTYLNDLRDQPRSSSEQRRDPSSPRGPRMHDFIQRFGNELELTDQQRTNITQILKTSQERMNGLMEEMQPKISQEFTRVNQEIKEHLSDEQSSRFEEIMLKRRMSGRGGFGPGRPGGSGPGRGPRGDRGNLQPGHERPPHGGWSPQNRRGDAPGINPPPPEGGPIQDPPSPNEGDTVPSPREHQPADER